MDWYHYPDNGAMVTEGFSMSPGDTTAFAILSCDEDEVDERGEQTVTRIRGNMHLRFQRGAAGDATQGTVWAAGIIVGPAALLAAGSASDIVDPLTQADYDFLWYRHGHLYSSATQLPVWNGSAVTLSNPYYVPQDQEFERFEIDSRAQRKLRKGESLYLVVSIDVGFGSFTGVAVYGRTRTLLKR